MRFQIRGKIDIAQTMGRGPFEEALDRITSQVDCSAVTFCLEKRRSVLDPDAGHLLKDRNRGCRRGGCVVGVA